MDITVISDKAGHGTAGACLDARRLPNPYEVPKFRHRDGRDAEVQAWVTSSAAGRNLVAEGVQAVGAGATTVTVICSAGRHRSVAIAEAIASELRAAGHQVTVDHRALNRTAAKKKPRKTTTESHLGWTHQQAREILLRRLRPGTPCWWCGRPMEKKQALDADHSTSRSHGGRKADRLLHARCNRQRGAGDQDQRRPALGAADAMPALPIRLVAGGDDPRWPAAAPEPKPAPPPPGGSFAWGNVRVS